MSRISGKFSLSSLGVSLIFIALCFIIYSNTFSASFHFDDSTSIVKNPRIKELKNMGDLSGSRYVGFLSFAINYHFGGLEVWGYHLVNTIIHSINSLLVYGFVLLVYRAMGATASPAQGKHPIDPRWIAFGVALLFLTHPIQTQAVTYIVQRFASLAALFYLLALVSYLIWRLGSIAIPYRFLPYFLAVFSTLLAMKTKENTFTLPLMILLIEASVLRRMRPIPWLALLPFLLCLPIIPLSHPEVLSDSEEESRVRLPELDRSDYLFTQFRVIVTYLRLLLLPIHQNVDYDYPRFDSLLYPQVFLSAMFLIFLMGLALKLLKGASKPGSPFYLFGFGTLWFFLTLSIESSIIPIRDVVFEHRLYLPSVGFLLATVSSAHYLLDRLGLNRASQGVILLSLSLALSIATYQRNIVWKDEVTLWRDIAQKSPNKVRVRYNLAEAFQTAGRLEESVEEYQAAVRIDPEYAKAYYNLASVYVSLNQPEDAISAYQAASRLRPRSPEVHNNLANVLATMGRYEEAVASYLRAIRLQPNKINAHFNLALAYGNLKRFDDAIAEYRKTIELDPEHFKAYYNLGTLYADRADFIAAEALFKAALSAKPDFELARQALATIQAYRSSNP